MRLWHEGRLLELPADLARRIEEQAKQLEEKARQLDERRRELDEAKSQLPAMTQWLRTQVRERASKAGRQDLAEQADDADAAQLQQWLDELE
jgi:peptidoglycan hydrolase CwlO-like protein